MDILFLETEASKLRINLLKTTSLRSRVFRIYNFFELILKVENRNAIESYILEFLPQYRDLISKTEFAGVDPAAIKDLLNQFKRIIESYPETDKENIRESLSVLQSKYDYLVSVLAGNRKEVANTGLCLPLLEKGIITSDRDYGILSTLSVQLKPKADRNKFHIMPGSGEPEAALKKQINDSLVNALRIAGNYVKLKHSYWDVYIDFEDKSGEYSGSSFGVILVVKLVEELLRFYDSPTKIFSFSSSALTGSVDQTGNIPSLSDEIIIQKTKAVFYSGAEVFVIPENDLPAARDILSELSTVNPDRNLKLVGIRSIEDLFNLRNVVGIRKESGLLRTAKFVRKQAVSVGLLILLVIIIFFSGILDFDNNPAIVNPVGRIFNIENKNGKLLWSFECMDNTNESENGLIRNIVVKLTDVNDDGINEVIAALEKLSLRNPNYGRIVCYNYKKEKLWQYIFSDSVTTPEYKHTTSFFSGIIDIITQDGKKVLYSFANNNPLYPSAIYKINARTGKRIDSTDVLWNSGGISSAVIGDFNNDGRLELAAIGLNNGYERSVLFSVDLDNMKSKTSPAPSYYKILGYTIADYNQYILLPKSDLNDLYYRWDSPNRGSLFFDKKSTEFNFMIGEYDQKIQRNLIYRCDSSMKNFYIDCGDDFQRARDNLVVKGVLKPPLTYTPEYFKQLKSQIKYWDGERFVTAEERFK